MIEAVLNNAAQLLGTPPAVLMASPFGVALGFHAAASIKPRAVMDDRGRSVDFRKRVEQMSQEPGFGDLVVTSVVIGLVLGLGVMFGLNPGLLHQQLAAVSGMVL